jgi:hypothetical protein
MTHHLPNRRSLEYMERYGRRAALNHHRRPQYLYPLEYHWRLALLVAHQAVFGYQRRLFEARSRVSVTSRSPPHYPVRIYLSYRSSHHPYRYLYDYQSRRRKPTAILTAQGRPLSRHDPLIQITRTEQQGLGHPAGAALYARGRSELQGRQRVDELESRLVELGADGGSHRSGCMADEASKGESWVSVQILVVRHDGEWSVD